MTAFDFLSIGHSNIAADRFVAMLQAAGAGAVGDVRTTPFSRFCPWFSAKNLTPLLQESRIGYLAYGSALGGRPARPELYCDGVADYEAMARQDDFQAGLDRLAGDAAQMSGRICLMCAEREPLDCHRCLLVARALAERGIGVGHILHDGTVTPHAAIERQLLADYSEGDDLFGTGQSDRLAAAYRRRARTVAYRAKAVSSGANTAAETR